MSSKQVGDKGMNDLRAHHIDESQRLHILAVVEASLVKAAGFFTTRFHLDARGCSVLQCHS